MAPRPRWVMRLQWRLHRWLYRLSGGRIGSRVIGLPVLHLTTIGHRSGEPRPVLLTYLDHPEGFVVVASNAGADRHPAWWRNLEENPGATVRRGGRMTPVRARRLEGEERERCWERFVEADSGYTEYARSAGRDFPVVLLARSAGEPGAEV